MINSESYLLAQNIKNPTLGPKLEGLQTWSISGFPGQFFTSLLSTLITLGLIIGSIVAFFTLLIGAIRWITSGGDKAGLEGAQKQITNGVIGLVLLFVIFAFFGLLKIIFGINILNIDLEQLKL